MDDEIAGDHDEDHGDGSDLDLDIDLDVDPERGAGQASLLRRLSVEGLFGRYDYELATPAAVQDRLMLVYGGNGTGKTTLLRILWHLLSPSRNRGHRTALAEIPFRRVTVELRGDVRIEVHRASTLLGRYELDISQNETTFSSSWPDGDSPFTGWTLEQLRQQRNNFDEALRTQADIEIARQEMYRILDEIDARPTFLADDRIIYDDALPRKGAAARDAVTFSSKAGAPRPNDMENALAGELAAVMRRASEMLRQLALGGAATGSAGANTVYLDVLRRLSQAGPTSLPDPNDSRNRLQARLKAIGTRSRDFERLGLVSEFAHSEFAETLRQLTNERLAIADEVLEPFLASLDARLDALNDARVIIQTFLDEINAFLVDKTCQFTPRTGLGIYLPGGERLQPRQLSSGERQLVLLLCTALLAREGARLFLIDEPELSLNVRWQRRIGTSLLNVTAGSGVQFIMATHSIELLSKFRANVVRLEQSRG